MKKRLLGFAAAVAAGLVGTMLANALDLKTIEQDLTPIFVSGQSSAASSTFSATGIALHYRVDASSWANVTFTVHYTTRTAVGGATFVSSSTAMTVLAGRWIENDFTGLAWDPSIVIHGLNTASTAYILLQVGQLKNPR